MMKWIKGVSSKAIALGVAIMMMVCMVQPASAASKIVSGKDGKYSYSDMKKDIRQLKKKYDDRIKVGTAGKTADKRSIYSITIGNESAKKKILVVAGTRQIL
jgi:ATP-dependent protease HslVU (ClpYQ) peptidase subunit